MRPATGVAIVLLLLARADAADRADSSVEFTIIDGDGAMVPCRIHLRDAEGRPRHPADLPAWDDHFVCDGNASIPLAAGNYRYEIERGPEHQRLTGGIDIGGGGTHRHRIVMGRIADLKQSGWYSGDVHVHRPVEDVSLLMRAEDLHVAPVITWWNQRNLWAERAPPATTLTRLEGDRWYDVMAGEDEREGGALLYFGLSRPLEIADAKREFPSPLAFAAAARGANPAVWIDIEKPFWWDVPVWLASGAARTIGIANNHMCRSRMYENEAWGRPRDSDRLPAPRGNGYWSQEIYYHVLNVGLRLPPSAGSASGVLPNPVGYNRAYVHLDGELTWEKWRDGLLSGRSFVTNGPLLICRANGEWPGHVFTVERGTPVRVDLQIDLTSLDHVPAVEVVCNGEVVETLAMEIGQQQSLTASLKFNAGDWFLIRAISDRPETFRFASTAPYYVEAPDVPPRISRRSAEFFLSWTREREERARRALTDPAEARAVLAFHDDAIQYWQDVVARANAD
jgi:hypothetical protein